MIKNKILENLYNKLLAEVAKSPENQGLRHLCESLKEICDTNKELVESGKRLDAEDGKKLSLRYKSFSDLCEDYIKNTADAAGDYLKAAFVPLHSYMNMLQEISQGALQGLGMQDVLWNDQVIDGLLTRNRGSKMDGPLESVQKTFANPKEALDLYKKITQTSREKFLKHVSGITGEPAEGRPLEVLDAKFVLLAEVADENTADQGKALKENMSIATLGERLKIAANRLLPENISPDTQFLSRENIDTIFDRPLQFVVMDGILANHIFPSETKDKIASQIHNIKTTYQSLGFTEYEMEQLEFCEEAAFIPEEMLRNIFDPDWTDERQMERFSDVFNLLDSVKAKIGDYLKGTGEAPSIEEYRQLYQLGIEHLKTYPLFYLNGNQDPVMDFFDSHLFSAIQDISRSLPALGDVAAQYRAALLEKIGPETQDILHKIGAVDSGADERPRRAAFSQSRMRANELFGVGAMALEDRDHINALFMAKNPEHLDKELEISTRGLHKIFTGSNDPESDLYGIDVPIADCRRSWIKENVMGNLIKAMLELPDNSEKLPEAFRILKTPGALNAEQTDALSDYLSLMENHPYLQKFQGFDNQTLEQVMEPGKMKAFCSNFIENGMTRPFDTWGISTDTANALTQKSGNLGSRNSDEYEAVKTAFLNLKNLEVPKGTPAENPVYQKKCLALYKACAEYVRTHDSKAASSNGRLRFQKAAEMMAKLTLPLMKAMPGERESIAQDVRLTMVRSKEFREILFEESNKELNALTTKNAGSEKAEYSARGFGEMDEAQKQQMDLCVRMIAYKKIVEQPEKTMADHIVKGKLDTEEKIQDLLSKTEPMASKAEAFVQEYRQNIISKDVPAPQNDQKSRNNERDSVNKSLKGL